MRIRSAVALLAVLLLSACGGGGLFKAYEYEEEMYLSLDGTATLYVNSSVPALNALRGSQFDVDPRKQPDREAVRAFFETPQARVTRVTFSRRSNRRYIHVRFDVPNIEALGSAAPFAWSTYSFKRDVELSYYRQNVAAATGAPVRDFHQLATSARYRPGSRSPSALKSTAFSSGVNEGCGCVTWRLAL